MKGQFAKMIVVMLQGIVQYIMPSSTIELKEQREGAVRGCQWPR